MEITMFNQLKLKFRDILCCLLIVGVSNISTASSKEKQGGVNGGGGNKVESLFKTKSLELASSLIEFDDESSSLLGFDTHALYASLNETGGFFALCATGERLAQIQKENKMARVFNETPGTVFLNCTDFSAQQWEEKLDWSNTANAIFLLHESLRIMDFAGEDNYGYSKNYIKGLKKENKKYYSLLLSLMSEGGSRKCSISLRTDRNSDDVFLFYYINKPNIYKSIYHGLYHSKNSITLSEAEILNKSSARGKEINDALVAVLKKVDCE
jgi:hypothetical protein